MQIRRADRFVGRHSHYIADADGSNGRRIERGRLGEPDGHRRPHLSFHSPSDAGTVFVTDDTGKLAFTVEGCCAWSPDGSARHTHCPSPRWPTRYRARIGDAAHHHDAWRPRAAAGRPEHALRQSRAAVLVPGRTGILLDDFLRQAGDGPHEPGSYRPAARTRPVSDQAAVWRPTFFSRMRRGSWAILKVGTWLPQRPLTAVMCAFPRTTGSPRHGRPTATGSRC